MTVLTYAVITPVRNERENLSRLADSLERQTVRPADWIVVDNGSADGSLEAARELERRLPWVTVLQIPGAAAPKPGAPVVRAFHAGLQRVSPERDVVVKLDADVSVDPDYFERQLDAFDADPRLGIAGGACLELRRGMWRPVDVTEGHVRGAARAYRRQCLDDVSPLEEGVGWDGIDALKASLHGWRTYTVEGLAFYHHRPLGDRDGSRAARWKAQGRACWFMGYRPSYLLLRTLHRARRNPAALAMIWSYLGAAVRREPRYGDAEVRGHLRERQSVAAALRRARSSRGRAASLRP